MNYNFITLKKNDLSWNELVLNRPKKANALSTEMIDEMMSALDHAKSDDSKGLWIKANGHHFCSGADLNEMQQFGTMSYDENLQEAKKLATFYATLAHFAKPMVMSGRGAIIGGGIGILACSDISVVTPNTSIAFTEAKCGIIPATIAPYIVRKIGTSKAQRYFLTGEKINLTSAQQDGLISEISEDPDSSVLKYINLMQENAIESLIAIKKQMLAINDNQQMAIKDSPTLLASIRSSDTATSRIQTLLKSKSNSKKDTK